MTIAELRPFQDKTVTLALSDGEITTAKISFVDAEHEDIVVDIIQTNRPDNYRRAGSAYAIAASDVASARAALESESERPIT